MKTIQLTKAQVFDELLEAEDTLEIDRTPGKHDCHYTTYVSKVGGKYYSYTLEFSYNNGCQTFGYADTVEATEVKPVEVKTIVWEEVK